MELGSIHLDHYKIVSPIAAAQQEVNSRIAKKTDIKENYISRIGVVGHVFVSPILSIEGSRTPSEDSHDRNYSLSGRVNRFSSETYDSSGSVKDGFEEGRTLGWA